VGLLRGLRRRRCVSLWVERGGGCGDGQGCLQSACGDERDKALRGRGCRSLLKGIADASVIISLFPKVEITEQQPLSPNERDPQV